MDISTIINDAFDYTRKMFADPRRLVVLVVLNVIPIVDLIITGYAAKVVKESRSSKEPPALKGYGAMWIQGLKIIVASVIWMIPPIILVAVGFGLTAVYWYPAISDYGYQTVFDPWVILSILGVLGAIGVAVAFIIAIIMVMGIVHMIKQNRFSKAFAVGEILEIIRRIGWGKYILWLIVIFVIAIAVTAIGTIPLVGWLISLIIGPLFAVFVARAALLIYSEGAPEPSPPPTGARYCRNCGEGVPPDAAFCPKCGQKVE